MKLVNGIKEIGLPFKIPNCSRDELPTFFKEMGYKVGAEIGVFRGEFTKKFCEVGLKMYAVDPWIGYVGAGRSEKVQDKQNINLQHAKKNLAPYPNCKIIRKTSMDAVKDFKDGSLDFVYIDGNHDFRHVAEDVSEWSKKVRKGGIVSGHDYLCTQPEARNVIIQTKHVIDAYVKTYNIKNFYTLGGTSLERRGDSTKSWFWIKNYN